MKKYAKETKLAAVHSYLEGIESLRTAYNCDRRCGMMRISIGSDNSLLQEGELIIL